MLRRLTLLLTLHAGAALAYPWMVKHQVAGCAACHVDPSGAGQLTAFGRMESERLVRWSPTPVTPGPTPNTRFLWFLELPEAVNLSGNLRYGAMVTPGAPKLVAPLEMATDLSATFSVDRLVVHATAGFGRKDVVAPAIVAPRCEPSADGECGPSFVARTWWLGLKAFDGAALVRGGRLALPFGLRNNEHFSWVRTLTLTDTNVNQKLGAALSFTSGPLRGEVMAIAGATLPSAQETGYSALLEYAAEPTLTLGASSLLASRLETRQAHGLFLRWAPRPALAVLAEADLLGWTGAGDRFGYAALAQADWEPVPGLHVMLTAESAHRGTGQQGPSLGAWASVCWYFFSHFELRVDNVVRRVDAGAPPLVRARRPAASVPVDELHADVGSGVRRA
ncbi:MAG: hypothetical protein ACOZQL_23065 [Myxococcota bacterium]